MWACSSPLQKCPVTVIRAPPLAAPAEVVSVGFQRTKKSVATVAATNHGGGAQQDVGPVDGSEAVTRATVARSAADLRTTLGVEVLSP